MRSVERKGQRRKPNREHGFTKATKVRVVILTFSPVNIPSYHTIPLPRFTIIVSKKSEERKRVKSCRYFNRPEYATQPSTQRCALR